MRRALAILFMASTLNLGAAAADPAVSHGAYRSGDRSIPFDLYRSETSRPLGGILLLHGADGMQSTRWADGYRQMALVLARAGFTVMVPHYFARTGTGWAERSTMVQNFLSWAETVADGISQLGKQPGVEAGRVGLVGISLGASLANSLATQDHRVAAVVDCFGTLPEFLAQHASRFAPTLILHGEKDAVVPVAEATYLESTLKAHNVPYEIKLYPGQGHGFTGAALADAEKRTLDFLTRYVG